MKTSFVADGDRDFLNLAERQLTILNYKVSEFRTAAELLKALKLKPNLIILGDLTDGSNAVETLRAIRKELTQAIIIHVAHINQFNNPVNSVRAGATEFVEKNSATFVRLRTTLDLLGKQKVKNTPTKILSDIKKVFIG